MYLNRDGVLIVDDRIEIIESAILFLKSLNIRCFSAKNSEEANKILEKNSEQILAAFIDNRLEGELGSELALSTKIKYPEINLSVLSAYNFDDEELNKLNEAQIEVQNKGDFEPNSYLKYFDSSDERVIKAIYNSKSLDPVADDTESDSGLREQLFQARIENQNLVLQQCNMEENWTQLAYPLIGLLKMDSQKDEEANIVNGKSYSTSEIIDEITKRTPLGLNFLDLYAKVMQDIVNDKLGSSESKIYLAKETYNKLLRWFRRK